MFKIFNILYTGDFNFRATREIRHTFTHFDLNMLKSSLEGTLLVYSKTSLLLLKNFSDFILSIFTLLLFLVFFLVTFSSSFSLSGFGTSRTLLLFGCLSTLATS